MFWAMIRPGPNIAPGTTAVRLFWTRRIVLTALSPAAIAMLPPVAVSVISSRTLSTAASFTRIVLEITMASATIIIFPNVVEIGAEARKVVGSPLGCRAARIDRSPWVATVPLKTILPPAASDIGLLDAATASN